MSVLLAVVASLSLYSVLSQRSWIGVLIGLQSLFGAVVVAMTALGAGSVEAASNLGLMVLVISQLQALAALGFAVRLHYLRARPEMSELRSMRN